MAIIIVISQLTSVGYAANVVRRPQPAKKTTAPARTNALRSTNSQLNRTAPRNVKGPIATENRGGGNVTVRFFLENVSVGQAQGVLNLNMPFAVQIPEHLHIQDLFSLRVDGQTASRSLRLMVINVDPVLRKIYLAPDPSNGRSPSSVNVIGNVEKGLMKMESSFSRSILNSGKYLSVSRQKMGPLPVGSKCQPKSVHFKNADLAENFTAATALSCESTFQADLSTQNKISFKVEGGSLDMNLNKTLDYSKRRIVLEDLSKQHFEEHKKSSGYVDESSSVVCETGFVQPNSADMMFCTRAFRKIAPLQDTVVMISRQVNDRISYVVIRAEGFSAENTKSIVAAYMKSMGDQQW